MNCPKCQSAEFDNGGQCLVCGFQTQANAAAEELAKAESALHTETETPTEGQDSSDDALNQRSEIPEWRLELSRRLQEIKSRRDVGDTISPAAEPVMSSEPAVVRDEPQEEPRLPSLRLASPRKPHRHARTISLDMNQDSDTAGSPALASSVERPDHQIPVTERALPPEENALPVSSNPVPAPQNQDEIKKLIDKVVAQQASQERKTIPMPESMSSAARMPVPPLVMEEPREGKLILLSRTLAGLVDLIIIVICGSMFIFAVDVLEGIEVFDAVSIIHYILLLLATYLLYSLFFLGIGSQTIGMMLTGLRVTGTTIRRPKLTQILTRCLVFLIGLSAIGIGLLWGCFDRQSRCLHDWLSRTRVERAQS